MRRKVKTMFCQVKAVILNQLINSRIFYILLYLTFSNSGFSQQHAAQFQEKKGSIYFDSLTLDITLDTLESVFDISFSYSKDQLPVDKRISLNIVDQTITKILEDVCHQAMIQYRIIGESIVLQRQAFPARKITISGKITDKETGLPIAYCTIGLKNKFIGTISNSDGEFDFHISELNAKDTLYASMMGFEPWNETVESFVSSNQLISLKESTLLLDEVVVYDQALNANELVRKAVNALRSNYTTKSTSQEGFYRNYFSINGKYVSLLEAAVVIDGGSIRRSVKNDDVFIREIRSNKGLSKTNSLFRESDENFLGTLLINDMIRNGIRKKRGEGSFLNYRRNEYEMDTVTVYNGRMVYVITCHTKQTAFDVSTTPYINAAMKLYIDAENYAIIRIERSSDFNEGLNPWNLGGDENQNYNMVYNKFIQEYREVEGKMYLSYFSSFFRFEVSDPATGERQGGEELVRELLINDVKLGRQNEFNWYEEMPKKINLENTIGEYNHEFWDHYNVIKATPLTVRILSDLEIDQSLESQFTDQLAAPKKSN